jgi:anaerobic magnesium-protoporphyrin IX monomethyl ester cyclase
LSKTIHKILLITPPYHSGVVESAGRWPNLGFIYIAGEVEKAGFEVELYDAMSIFDTYDQIRDRIKNSGARFVCSTAITATINDAIKVLEIAKEELPGVTTLLGGVHPTFCYEEILNGSTSVDYCVLGEGELTAPELLTAITGGKDVSKVQGIAYKQDGSALLY